MCGICTSDDIFTLISRINDLKFFVDFVSVFMSSLNFMLSSVVVVVVTLL